ncbi:ABC transporter ATP-binding protein [Xanthomonas sp. AmX2]|uniref:oligopeptide/dipeptide ABC transporter ATP-binding protein n=1 Tax=Xanthomonas sp. TaxID=29446 RepID=UPI001981D914|nr:ABC transporter ATP-binding protein [Xanthomonas sp.]
MSFTTPRGTVRIVHGVSYSVAAGETLAIVGESGSGKSVQALAIAGLLEPKVARVSGRVMLGGRDLLALGEPALREIRGRDIGFVFQDPMTSLNPLLTIGRQLAEPLYRHLRLDREAARNRCLELLEQVGVDRASRRLQQYPHQLSGGQRQRVMIAIGIACRPRLLIADEATTALDVTVQAQIVDLLRELKDALGMALVWITHDMGVVARLADTVQVMYAGRIAERGPVDALFHDPRSAYTLGLLRSLPGSVSPRRPHGGRLRAIPGQPPDPFAPPPGDPFEPRNPYATERCRRELPPLRPAEDAAPGHLVAAWYDLRRALAEESCA